MTSLNLFISSYKNKRGYEDSKVSYVFFHVFYVRRFLYIIQSQRFKKNLRSTIFLWFKVDDYLVKSRSTIYPYDERSTINLYNSRSTTFYYNSRSTISWYNENWKIFKASRLTIYSYNLSQQWQVPVSVLMLSIFKG